jgi:hypothetical protein
VPRFGGTPDRPFSAVILCCGAAVECLSVFNPARRIFRTRNGGWWDHRGYQCCSEQILEERAVKGEQFTTFLCLCLSFCLCLRLCCCLSSFSTPPSPLPLPSSSPMLRPCRTIMAATFHSWACLPVCGAAQIHEDLVKRACWNDRLGAMSWRLDVRIFCLRGGTENTWSWFSTWWPSC